MMHALNIIHELPFLIRCLYETSEGLEKSVPNQVRLAVFLLGGYSVSLTRSCALWSIPHKPNVPSSDISVISLMA